MAYSMTIRNNSEGEQDAVYDKAVTGSAAAVQSNIPIHVQSLHVALQY
jgi:hypothetical protein